MKAALTGWAWRTPLGPDPEAVLERLLAGETAAAHHRHLAGAPFEVALGGAITAPPAPSKHQRFLRRMGLYALDCGKEAFLKAGIKGGPRVGVFLGYGGLRAHWNDMMPALEHQQEDGQDAWDRGFRLFHPFWMLQHLSNNAQALLAMELGARGEGITCGGANAGAQALGAAQRALSEGTLDAALVVAHDTLLEPETLVELGSRAQGAIRGESFMAPYGGGGSGFLPGEAAVALVLERPAGCAGRALGFLHAADGADGSREEPGQSVLAAVVERALDGVDCDVVDGAARGWMELDGIERRTLASILGEETPLTATQAAFGQLGAAAAPAQALALVLAMRRGVLPPIASLSRIELGPLRPLTKAEPSNARCALVVSTGAPGLVGAVRVEVA